MTRTRLSYCFGPLERRGLFGPITVGQVAVLAAGVVVAMVILDSAPSASGASIAATAVVVSALIALVPVGRRTLQQWAPVGGAFAAAAAVGRLRFRSRAPGAGVLDGIVGERTRPRPHPPRRLRDVRIGSATYRDRPIGVISSSRGRRLTAVLACRVTSFALLDPEAQERRLARWGLVLSGAAGTPIRRLQWIERTAPAQGDELARWVSEARDPAVPLRGTPMIESYLELIGTTATVTQEHEILLSVEIDSRRTRGRGPDTPTQMLIEQTERVAAGLEAAEVNVLGALSQGQLARVLRTSFDPYAGTELTALEAADPGHDGLGEASAWPLGAREHWDHYRADGALHATFWIAGWPRVEVSPMFMDALLGRSGTVRTVAVAFEPIAPERSTREVEAAVTRDHAERDLRRRFGQTDTARHRQAEDATVRREAELAAGHGEVRFAGFITVSGRDPDDLRRACAEVSDHAARARLELHRMYGQQAEAFTFTLPLCRGLR